jgi:hypothetical protein
MIVQTVIDSAELGQTVGKVGDLDAALTRLPKEPVARRCVAILHALAADLRRAFSTVNSRLVIGLPDPERTRLLKALENKGSVFFEPFQQLVLLRRALAVCPTEGDVALESDEGIRLYVAASRIATDVIRAPGIAKGDRKTDDWLKVAAGFMTRLWITHPVDPVLWIGRSIAIFEDLPKSRAELDAPAQRLKDALAAGLGVSYTVAMTLIRFLSLWSLRARPEQLAANPQIVGFDPRHWIESLKIPADEIQRFLDRTSRGLDDPLDDNLPGGQIGFIPLRDRPLLRFNDGTIAPVYPELLIEKMTPLVFWWTTTPGEEQKHHWAADWGVLAEAYALSVLERIAKRTACTFVPDLKQEGEWQVDGAIWSPDNRLVLVEVSAGALRDAEAIGGDAALLKSGLHRIYVESLRKGRPKAEAVKQLARDVQLLIDRDLQKLGVPEPTRVYSLLVVFDRRLQAPGAWLYLDDELAAAFPKPTRWPISALAVITIEELESIEAMADAGKLAGEPPGILKALRLWEATSPRAQAWWHHMNRYWPDRPVNARIKKTGDDWAESMREWFA